MSHPLRTLAASSNVVARYWQLLLLGFTSVSLSFASGWTTWDGMRNFTDNGVLSFLITFGIQGVMLITAWMIGETFAEKEKVLSKSTVSRHRSWLEDNAGRAIAIVLCLIVIGAGIVWFSGPYPHQTSDWHFNYAIAIATLIAGIVFLRNFLYASGNGEIARPYDHSIKTILRNLPLWLMFLVCLAASVFFSFDSLFDKIFSSEDRARAGQSRIQIEVSGLLSDLPEKLAQNRRAAASSLFASPQWRTYEEQIRVLELEASKTPELFHAIRKTQTALRDQEISEELEASSVEEAKLGALEERINLANQELSETATALRRAKSQAFPLEERLSALRTKTHRKSAEAKAEAIGIGVTQKAGEGPQYRQIKKEQDELRIATELLAEELKDAQAAVARLAKQRISKATHAAKLKSEAAKIRGRIELAKDRLTALRAQGEESSDQPQSIAANLDALKEAERNFVNTPGKKGFAQLQHQCAATLGILKTIKNGAAKLDQIDCTASFASERTGKVYAANAASKRFGQACGKGITLDGRSTDELLRLAHDCLQISGLQTAEALPLRSRLRKAALRRDDRAHRFIVTWNAFFDENHLAFLALFIALAIDGLVFMSGLFGARARAQLSSDETGVTWPNRANQEVMLDAALLPNAHENARIALKAVTYSDAREPGEIGHIDVSQADGSSAEVLRNVLNAASIIDFVRRTGTGERYAIKPEFVDYLSRQVDMQRGMGAGALAENKAEELLRVSLGAQKREIAQFLLEASRPVEAQCGFTHEFNTKRCPSDIRPLITGVLNAGVASGFVLGDPDKESRYLISAAFFSLVARLAEQNETVEPRIDSPSSAPIKVRKRLATSKDASSSLCNHVRERDRTSPSPLEEKHGHVAEKQVGAPPLEPALPPPKSLPFAKHTRPAPVGTESPPAVSAEFKSLTTQTTTSASERVASTSSAQSTSQASTPPVETKKAGKSKMRVGERTADNTQTTSKLISFSNEAKIRRSEPDTVEKEPQSAAQSANELSLTAFNELRGVTGLTNQQLSQLCDPQGNAKYDEACAALDALRTQNDLFDKKITHMEQELRRALVESVGHLESPFSDQSQSEAEDRSIPLVRFIDQNFALIFLRARGLKEAQHLCTDIVSHVELTAGVYATSAADIERLGELGKCVRSFLVIDGEHAAKWRDLISRIEGVRQGHERSAAFADIMP